MNKDNNVTQVENNGSFGQNITVNPGGCFMFIIGAFVMCVFLLLTTNIIKPQVESKTKIQPEWKIITDGKKVDTLWIYKKK